MIDCRVHLLVGDFTDNRRYARIAYGSDGAAVDSYVAKLHCCLSLKDAVDIPAAARRSRRDLRKTRAGGFGRSTI
jgi:hypothetical protein